MGKEDVFPPPQLFGDDELVGGGWDRWRARSPRKVVSGHRVGSTATIYCLIRVH